MNIFTLVERAFLIFFFFFFFLFILAKVLATRGPGFVVRRWSKAPLFFLSLLFFSVHHDLTEKRVIFSLANKPRARFWQRNNCCQLGRDIVCHRDAPLLSSKGSSLIYIPLCLEFGPRRNANRYGKRKIDLSS